MRSCLKKNVATDKLVRSSFSLLGNVPHVARNVWPNDILEFVLIEE